jgi:hypothetical protein
LKKGCQKIGYFGAKNGNISRSVNSFGTGAIFWPRLGQDLSGNAFVGPFLFSGQKNDCSKDFCMTHKMTKNYKKSNFSESLRDSARRLPGWFQGLWEFLKPVGMISQDARQKLKNRSFW